MSKGVLAQIFGSKAAEACLLHLHHHGETYGRAVSADMEVSLASVQRQLEKFEDAGALISKECGRTRVYLWNPRGPVATHLEALAKAIYDSIPLARREQIFSKRRRPRAKKKPVIR